MNNGFLDLLTISEILWVLLHISFIVLVDLSRTLYGYVKSPTSPNEYISVFNNLIKALNKF